MSRIDIGQNILKPKVVAATAAAFLKAADDEKTGAICAELEDLLEKNRRGELSKEEYKKLKDQKKKGCRFYTPHAHFAKGYKRGDCEPVDSAKAIIDLDGCEHFAQVYESRLKGRERKLGINMVNISVSKTGGHVLFDIPEGLTRQQAQAWMAHEMGDVEYDLGVHEPERAVFIPCREYILYLDEGLMFGDELKPAVLSDEELKRWQQWKQEEAKQAKGVADRASTGSATVRNEGSSTEAGLTPPACGHPLSEGDARSAVNERTRFIAQGVLREKHLTKGDFLTEGRRHTTVKIFLSGVTQLLTKDEANGILAELMPKHWEDENIQQLVNDFYARYNDPTQRLFKYQEQLFVQSQRLDEAGGLKDEVGDVRDEVGDMNDDADDELSTANSQLSTKRMPQGVRESIEAVGPQLAMPVVTAICPCIGALATGVQLDVHGQKRGLNLIAYIAGDFASGKGQIDPVVDAWMSEVKALDRMYQMQEDEWRAKKRAAKNKKEQPEEPKLPVRCLTLNNTVANLAERLANTEGKHAFSFTPEADTVAQKWRSAMSDFSVMLRESYDGTKYEREAKSAEAVNVHIEKLLWNVTMCGTPDALYRVVSNYTDGLQSRIALARTPDNTFAPLDDTPYIITSKQTEHIQQVAHLLPLMQGDVELPKLEQKGRAWLEKIRLETMKNDDKVKARQRFRACVIAQRMTCCIMLCKVCETLISKHGVNGAETRLKQFPNLWKEMLLKTQTPQMLEHFDVIADSLLENALYFFRDRIENAFASRDYVGNLNGERRKRGKNDSIFARLDVQFTFEQAMQHSVAIKGAGVTRNSVQQMLKNWNKQGLMVQTDDMKFRKL